MVKVEILQPPCGEFIHVSKGTKIIKTNQETRGYSQK